ncbi:MAG: prephenate dehydrogenase/arogenate dehydrogenase family protein [bacterium]
MNVKIGKLAIIGTGLIGGSFALALKKAQAVDFVVGCGRTLENLRDALAEGIIDDATTDPGEAVRDADLVFIAVPVGEISNLCLKIAHELKPGAIVTDAGSTKEIVLGELFGHLPPYVNIVGGHPIAGKEKTGAAAAEAELFQDRITIITPDKTTDPDALELIKKLWEAAGSRVEIMEPAEHDKVLGAVSHLPHMVAYALVDTLLEWEKETPLLRFSAGGLRDYTRIAASSPQMWRDICLDNKEAIIEAIDRFSGVLEELRADIENLNKDALTKRFERTREVRKKMGGKG